MRDGWFRSGDLGRRDKDGYYYIVDRAKDMIIRGGFNVYPREIEEVLMTHEAVSLAAVIGVPHPTHGEEVAAAVVLRPGFTPKDTELRDFCAERLAGFKVPRKIVFLPEIPKGATGKLQRIGLHEKLADKLGLAG